MECAEARYNDAPSADQALAVGRKVDSREHVGGRLPGGRLRQVATSANTRREAQATESAIVRGGGRRFKTEANVDLDHHVQCSVLIECFPNTDRAAGLLSTTIISPVRLLLKASMPKSNAKRSHRFRMPERAQEEPDEAISLHGPSCRDSFGRNGPICTAGYIQPAIQLHRS